LATSGTASFSVNRDEIISASLRTLGVIGVGESPITEDYTNCSQALNIMIKSWVKKGFPLWVYQTIVIPQYGSLGTYPLGPTGGNIYSVTITDGGTGYPDSGTVTFTGGTTGTSAAGTYTASSGVIQSVTMTVNGDTYLTAPAVSFSGGGSGAAGTANIAGLTIPRPLRIMYAYVRNPSNFDTPLNIISETDFDTFGNKFSEGVTNQIYYNNQLVNGVLKTYNIMADDGWTIYAIVQRMFEDMTTSTDDFDFPQEWYQALKWGLCAELSDEYGVDENKIARIQMKADAFLDECSNWSQEEAGISFSLNPQGMINR
jgi:hypothetical protein